MSTIDAVDAHHLLADVLEHPEFIAGNTTTDFIPKNMSDWSPATADVPDEAFLAAALDRMLPAASGSTPGGAVGPAALPEPWELLGSFEVGGRIEAES